MADALSGLKQKLFELMYHPTGTSQYNPVFQERFSRAYGMQVPKENLPPDVSAQYQTNFPLSEAIGHILNYGPRLDMATASALNNLRNSVSNRGMILVPPNPQPQILQHEAAHALYDEAGVSKYINELNNLVPHDSRQMVTNSALYGPRMKDDPTVLSDESLGYAMGSPYPEDAKYVNDVANKMPDELKKRLLALYQHSVKK